MSFPKCEITQVVNDLVEKAQSLISECYNYPPEWFVVVSAIISHAIV